MELVKSALRDEGWKAAPVLMVVNNYIVSFNAATLQEKLNKIFP